MKKFITGTIAFLLSVIVTLLITSIFLPNNYNAILVNVFSDIYDYSTADSKDLIIQNFENNCNGIQSKNINEQLNQFKDICNDKEKQASLKANCAKEESGENSEFCKILNSNQFDDECDKLSNEKISDKINSLNKISRVCKSYNDKKLNKKEFYLEMIGTLPTHDEKGDEIAKIINGIKQSIIYQVFSIILLILLLFLINLKSLDIFLKKFFSILLKSGIFLLLPFMIYYIYVLANPIDDMPLNELIAPNSADAGIPQKILFSLAPIVFKNLMPAALAYTGAFFMVVGICGIIILKIKKH